MCIHTYMLDEPPLTREERLMDLEAVRTHHLKLVSEANRGVPGALRRFHDHREAHHLAAVRLRAERAK